jgi:hypothetical protein
MAGAKRSSQKGGAPARVRSGYWEAARQPLYCLLLLFPLVATYEFGALIVNPGGWPQPELVAYGLIQGLLGWLGASGFWLPGVVLLLTLLIWHLLSGNPWQIRGWVLPLMLAESLLLAVPLFVLNRVMLTAGAGDSADLAMRIMIALGAGVYEELVFRLYLITGLTLLLVRVLRVPRRVSVWLVIGLAAAVFAACHVQPVGAEPFAWPAFLMRLGAGVYLSLIFVARGLGVATGCHAAYNLILVSAITPLP